MPRSSSPRPTKPTKAPNQAANAHIAGIESLNASLSAPLTLDADVLQALKDLRANDVDMITLGQYLQPSKHHLPLVRYVHPDEFNKLGELGYELGFTHVASGPMVRSSYHADRQATELVGP